MRNFRQLRIWKNGMHIAINTFRLIETFPRELRFGFSNQMINAAVSIPSNIAEGSSRSSEKEYMRFIEIALGSSFELDTQLSITEAINMGNPDIKHELHQCIEEENIMLHAFLARLRQQK
jgi:four helix bundle protein